MASAPGRGPYRRRLTLITPTAIATQGTIATALTTTITPSQPVESVQDGGLALPGGGWVAADLIVTAVGVRPCTGWLDGSGVELGNGVIVDGCLQSSMPGVYAAGDCAAFWSGRYGRRLRVEHWDTALHAPSVAAAVSGLS